MSTPTSATKASDSPVNDALAKSAAPPAARIPITQHSLFRPLAALGLLLLIDLIMVPGFFNITVRDGHLYGSLIDIVNRGAPLILTALGMTLVIATRGIDISVGAIVALSGAIACVLIGGDMEPATSLMVAMGAAMGAALLCGLWNGVLVSYLGLQPIVATLILMVAGRGIAQLFTDGQILTVYYEPFSFLGGGYFLGLPFAVTVVAVVFGLVAFMMKKTALGLFIQAVGINPVAARLAGLKTSALILSVYIFSGACAGLAGLMISSNIKSADANNAGLMLELDAILAVTLGGTSLAGGKFSLVGSVIGALIIQTLTYTIYSLGIPPEVNMVVKSIVVFLVCLSQSSEFKNMFKLGKARKSAA